MTNENKTIEDYVDKGDYKRDFVKWMDKNFRYFNTSEDTAALEEIKQNAAVTYLKTMTERWSADVLQRYYRTDWLDISIAYQKKDMDKFAKAVASLIGGIEVE